MRAKFTLIKDILLNIFFRSNAEIIYIVENVDWSIRWDGKYLTKNLHHQYLLTCALSTTHIGLRKKIIHFGSINTFLATRSQKVHPSNTIILTWFHIAPTPNPEDITPLIQKTVSLVHTSCTLTAKKIHSLGIPAEKIKIIPLGVDLELFRQYSQASKKTFKKKLGIPEGRLVIGSFQKDGNGWGEGNDPKFIKGPDIFCETVKKIAHYQPIHILLTGPARGYVKKQLRAANISYTHRYLKNYPAIVHYYNILDLYLISSREEGGPKALLESMACGIPVISTRVGMAPDILTGTLTHSLVDSEDTDGLSHTALRLFSDISVLHETITAQSTAITKYDWKHIAQKYYQILYEPILTNLSKEKS